jgi:hypothetical protein
MIEYCSKKAIIVERDIIYQFKPSLTIPKDYFKDFVHYLNELTDEVTQVTSRVDIKKIESCFPIHAQIVDCEAIEAHKLAETITKLGGIPLLI